MLFGILNLSFWGYVVATLLLTHITIASVTIFLHRNQSHRALTLHPVISHFFRFWLWITTGMVTRDWVAIHRKHHANTDVEGDPHSPQVLSLKKVLFEGAELYREACKDTEMIEKYSHGTPNDWLERNVYGRFPGIGITLMFILDIVFFGIPGITIWAIQMMWIPFFAAGVINGIGHFWGYRSFECRDAATNIIPWGILIGGEELHNNHHTYASSAKLSVKWWEFDIGWMYIKLLSWAKLAKVKKLPPKLAVEQGKLSVDMDTVKAVVSNRFQVMAKYYKQVALPVLKSEKKNKAKEEKSLFRRARRLMRLDSTLLNSKSRLRLTTLLERKHDLNTVYAYRVKLQNVWLKTASSQKELLESLQIWCKQAENSGVEALRLFAQQIRNYVPKKAIVKVS
jgi:stearoyl-CoA desaturase (Delta-9 desaturase)